MTVGRVVPILTVEDIDTARDAYVAALGLTEVMNHGWILTLADAERRHQLSLMTRDQTAAVNPVVSVEVDAAYAAAVAAGLPRCPPRTGASVGSSLSTAPATSSTFYRTAVRYPRRQTTPRRDEEADGEVAPPF